MGQVQSQTIFAQMLQAALKMKGIIVGLGQLTRFLDFVKEICPWFPKDGTINLEAWQKVGDAIKAHYKEHGADKTPVDAFTLWSLIRDCLMKKNTRRGVDYIYKKLRKSASESNLSGKSNSPHEYEVPDNEINKGAEAAKKKTVKSIYPNLQGLEEPDWADLEDEAARYHDHDEIVGIAALSQLRKEIQTIANCVKRLQEGEKIKEVNEPQKSIFP